MRMTGIFICFLLVCLLAVHTATGTERTRLMPNDIVFMHRNGFSTEQIINSIVQNGIGFEVTLPVLQDLMAKGVSTAVLEVLLGQDPSRSRQTLFHTNTGPRQPGITISTEPAGMSLFINGEPQGVTPGFSNTLQKGRHVIRVEHPLFFPRQEEIVFDGENSLVLRWKLEPREPVVRVRVTIDRAPGEESWSWIIRPRNRCPGCEVSLQMKAWEPLARAGEAVFLLEDESKRLFRGTGVACLEVNIWRGEVRRDLPLRRLPPPSLRYYISDIQINGIELVDLIVSIRLKEIETAVPEVSLDGKTGFLILEGDHPEPTSEPQRRNPLTNGGTRK